MRTPDGVAVESENPLGIGRHAFAAADQHGLHDQSLNRPDEQHAGGGLVDAGSDQPVTLGGVEQPHQQLAIALENTAYAVLQRRVVRQLEFVENNTRNPGMPDESDMRHEDRLQCRHRVSGFLCRGLERSRNYVPPTR